MKQKRSDTQHALIKCRDINKRLKRKALFLGWSNLTWNEYKKIKISQRRHSFARAIEILRRNKEGRAYLKEMFKYLRRRPL